MLGLVGNRFVVPPVKRPVEPVTLEALGSRVTGGVVLGVVGSSSMKPVVSSDELGLVATVDVDRALAAAWAAITPAKLSAVPPLTTAAATRVRRPARRRGCDAARGAAVGFGGLT